MFCGERELETEQNCNILTPTLMAINVVSFSFSWCSTRGPGAHSTGFLYYILLATSLDPNSSGAPKAPSAWCGFPYYISSITPSPTVWLFVLTELYKSSTPTQSPTRYLEWHVWSSSSGNNGASVYESIMGFFTLSHFISQACPGNLFRLLAIEMCQFLPVQHFVMACLPGPKVKIQHYLEQYNSCKKKNTYFSIK